MNFKRVLSAIAISGALAGSLAACGPPQMTLSEGCAAFETIWNVTDYERESELIKELQKRGPKEFAKADLKALKAANDAELAGESGLDVYDRYREAGASIEAACRG